MYGKKGRRPPALRRPASSRPCGSASLQSSGHRGEQGRTRKRLFEQADLGWNEALMGNYLLRVTRHEEDWKVGALLTDSPGEVHSGDSGLHNVHQNQINLPRAVRTEHDRVGGRRGVEGLVLALPEGSLG